MTDSDKKLVQGQPRAAAAPQAGYRVVASFRDGARAQDGIAALRAAGVDPADVSVAGGAQPPSAASRSHGDAPFLGRLVVIVVVWSILGTGIGVVMGLILNAAQIGPGGATGLLIQVVSWAIFAHLIVGMCAGYALLTRGESRQPVAATRDGRVLVSIRCGSEAARDRVESVARSAGAAAVGVYDPAGRPVPRR